MRTFFCFLLPLSLLTTATRGAEPAVTRLAGVTFQIADLDKARQFYTNIFGLEEAFDLKMLV